MSVLFVAFSLALSAHATEVYRWVDEAGVVHFSQVAPANADTDTEKLTIEDDRPSDYDPDSDIYGVAEQAERMQALREEMQEKRAAAIERSRQTGPEIAPREPDVAVFPAYRRPWLRPPWPQPPIARPPGSRPPGAGDWIRPPAPITPPSPRGAAPIEP